MAGACVASGAAIGGCRAPMLLPATGPAEASSEPLAACCAASSNVQAVPVHRYCPQAARPLIATKQAPPPPSSSLPPTLRLGASMDWDDEEFLLTASQEAALQALERGIGGGSGSGDGLTGTAPAAQCQPPPSAQPGSSAAFPQAAGPHAPVVQRRKLPAILSNDPPAGGSSSKAAGAGTGPAATAGDENLPPARFAGRLCYAHTGYGKRSALS